MTSKQLDDAFCYVAVYMLNALHYTSNEMGSCYELFPRNNRHIKIKKKKKKTIPPAIVLMCIKMYQSPSTYSYVHILISLDILSHSLSIFI